MSEERYRNEISEAINAVLGSIFKSKLDGDIKVSVSPIQDVVDKAYARGKSDTLKALREKLKKIRETRPGLGACTAILIDLAGEMEK